MQNPFTTTFSKLPEYTYIISPATQEILDNLSFESPSESVYKITGVRGSGKTVVLSKIEEELKSEDNKKKGWIVFDLNPTRNMLMQFAAMLLKEGYGKNTTKKRSVNLSATILGTGGGIGYSSENEIFDIGVEIETMIQEAQKRKKKLFIGIDEVSKTPEMITFTSEFGRWLRAKYPVYLVCTGLFENIQEVSNVKNLTFFRRATTIQTEPLNMIRVTEMYKSKLGVNHKEALEMAKCTKGYAYAFQELGVLYFKKKKSDTLKDIIPDFKTELFVYSYEKIWEEMSETDRFLTSLLKEDREYKREEILSLMGKRANCYSMYRDRLQKRGIIDSRHGFISLSLPFFADYIEEYS